MRGILVNVMKHLYIYWLIVIIPAELCANSIADGVLQKTLVNPSQVTYNTENNNRGREYKAGDAKNQANKGKGVAIAVGSALMAAAIPMLASPLPPVQAAGAELMAKAGLEFAQAGADKKNADTNGAQENLLTRQYENRANQKRVESSSDNEIRQKAMTPELAKLLSEKGISSDDFANQLAGGQLTTVSDVLRAMGNQTEISVEDLQQGQAIASQQLGSIMLSVNTEPLLPDITVSSSPTKVMHSTGSDASAIDSIGSDVKLGVTASASASSTSPGSDISKADKKKKQITEAAGIQFPSMLKGLLAQYPTLNEKEAAVLAKMRLEQQGILIPKGGQNIFQLAHRSFRNFHKWRKEELVAANRL